MVPKPWEVKTSVYAKDDPLKFWPPADWKLAGYGSTIDGEVLYDFYRPHEPVYVPGYGPDDVPQQSLTRQEFKDECDVNVIMKQYEGAWPPPPATPPVFMDFSEVPDSLMGAFQFLDAANVEFMKLPASVRLQFNNSPFEFVDFASDPGNLDQMREWGLAPKPPEAPAASPAPPPTPPSGDGK